MKKTFCRAKNVGSFYTKVGGEDDNVMLRKNKDWGEKKNKI